MTNLSGQIEKITYTNEENGFTVAQVKVDDRPELVTVVGNLMAPMPGEVLHMTGEWQRHAKYGEQFRIHNYKTVIPITVTGIRKYLGSGLIRGIGPVMAERIVKKFGKDTLHIIQHETDRLSEIDGIGVKRIQMIQQAWEDQEAVRDVMIFLQAYGVSSGYAAKIFKIYGDRSTAIVKQNPYRLATDIAGIGFLTADRIAAKLGFSKNTPVRIEAGIGYVLQQLADDGHVYYPYEPLVAKVREMLQVDQDVILQALKKIEQDQTITVENIHNPSELIDAQQKAVYLTQFYVCETQIAQRIKQLLHSAKQIRVFEPERAISWLKKQVSISLTDKQIEAITCTLSEKVMVITGGPGTGKTTIIQGILKIYSRLGARILLAAPTGRAAKRMSETTSHNASTIHRLLQYNRAKGGFQKNEEKPLNCDAIIVDEASMIDTVLMHHLLKAIPQHATFILVGDIHQLPSVGAGNILNDIITSGIVPVVELDEIFRQAQQSRIIVNAHRINTGVMPIIETSPNAQPGNDFFFIEQEDPERVLEIIIALTTERIPGRFGFDPVDQIQVLTPMHKGTVGAENLNAVLQESLNGEGEMLVMGNRKYRVNDKVMQIRNNYEKDVYNGDIGRIVRIDSEDQELVIAYEGRDIMYDSSDLDEIVLAYAISIHKSQGSEFPAVIIPVLTQHYILLQRNLIYTAVTRGRNLVVLVGTRKALAIGINNNEMQTRFTYLTERLKE